MLMEIPRLLSAEEVRRLRELADKGQTVDGKATAGEHVRHLKNNLEIQLERKYAIEVDTTVRNALRNNELFQDFAHPRLIAPPILNRYEPGMEYGEHMDNAFATIQGQVMRTDMSVTVFLSDPDSYEGGNLRLETPVGEKQVKLNAGDAVTYSTTMLHRVQPVTAGARVAAVTWVQSYVRDAAKREILFDLHRLMKKARARDKDSAETRSLFKTYLNLLKMWAD